MADERKPKRVRLVAEWIEELPANGLNVGDVVAVPAEMAVRRTTPKDVYVKGKRVDTELLAELAPHLVTPGSKWRVHCTLDEGTTTDWGHTTATRPAELERETATMAEALDALAEFAEAQVKERPLAEEKGCLRGYVRLGAVEPGEEHGFAASWNRGVAIGADFKRATVGEFLAALDQLADEADELFGTAGQPPLPGRASAQTAEPSEPASSH